MIIMNLEILRKCNQYKIGPTIAIAACWRLLWPVVFIGVAVRVSTQDTVLGVMSVVHPEDGHGWTTGSERFFIWIIPLNATDDVFKRVFCLNM